MLQCTFGFSFRRKEEIIMKVDDSYKHVDGSNEGNYGSQTKFERHIVFAPFLIIIFFLFIFFFFFEKEKVF
jgi:hypothetical protein